jgi:hypothetical protein
MAASGNLARSPSPGPRPPRWAVLGWGLGILVFGAGAVGLGAPVAGLSTATAATVALGGATLALAALVAYLLLPAPEGGTMADPAARSTGRPGAVSEAVPSTATPRVRRPEVAETPEPFAVPRAPTPTAAAQLSAANAVRRAVGVGTLSAATVAAASPPSPTVPSEAVGDPSEETNGGGLSSIPGAYLQALGSQRDPAAAWNEIAPPIAAALPFAPGIQPSRAERPSGESPDERDTAGILELELARLRARVRELESPRPSVAPTRTSAPSPVAAAPRGPEPPAPSNRVAVTHRGCAGCGGALASSQHPPLCWGCGRALCAGCYWRFGPGPGLHRCPECATQAPSRSTGISGGRIGRPSEGTPGPGAAESAMAPPAVR